jgi:hypothetical protein
MARDAAALNGSFGPRRRLIWVKDSGHWTDRLAGKMLEEVAPC